MKAKLGHYVQWLREGFLQMLRLHPVEAGLIALGCIGCLVAYETDSDDTLVRLALVPLAFAVALAFNNLAGLGPWAESLLGMLGAFRAVRALGRSGRVARQRAVVHHLRHPGALGAAALSPCRVQQAVRRRHHGVAAFGHPRCALRQCSAGVVLRYPLLHDLYLRARRELDSSMSGSMR